MIPFARILVPHDFSDYSDNAIKVAADVARRYAASITLLHVLEHAEPSAEVAAKRLERAEHRVRAAGVERVDTKILHGVPFDTIIRFAEDGGYDLIVMGSQGRTGIARAMIGSVAERVVRLAKRPVLTVHWQRSGVPFASAH